MPLKGLLESGCRVLLRPPPFDHSKLMTIDDAWSLIGSANWDTRSFRLNFELNVEIKDEAFARRLEEAGVEVELRHYPGMIHGFLQMADSFDQGKLAIQHAGQALRRALAP